jgi:hypothetical protein
MNAFDKEERQRSHLEIQETVPEPQALISWGEGLLDRAHRLSHEIEKQVRQALRAPANAPPQPRPATPDPQGN